MKIVTVEMNTIMLFRRVKNRYKISYDTIKRKVIVILL